MKLRLLMAVILLSACALAQGVPPPQRITIKSAVLKEERLVLVRLPRNYLDSVNTERYPVLYMTDGSSGMAHAISTVEFLVRSGRIPDLIVVGIENTDRNRDLTPTVITNAQETMGFAIPSSGGADDFLRFIETELMPEIDTRFRTARYRVFAGHSFGALFGVHTLLTRPDAFHAYIAASPSLHWDNASEVKRAQQFFAGRKELNKTLYLTIANEGGPMQQEFDRFSALLKSSRLKGLEWAATPMPDEDHGSSVLRAYYSGLRLVFADWQLPNDVRSVKAADAHYQHLATKYGVRLQTPEAVINRIGYVHIRDHRYTEAIEAFKANVERFPNSANVYDSLAEAYVLTQQFTLARQNAQKAVELATANQDGFLPTFRERLEKINAGFAAAAK